MGHPVNVTNDAKNISDEKVAKDLKTDFDHQRHLYVDSVKRSGHLKLVSDAISGRHLTLKDRFEKIDRQEVDLTGAGRITNSRTVTKSGKVKIDSEKEGNDKNIRKELPISENNELKVIFDRIKEKKKAQDERNKKNLEEEATNKQNKIELSENKDNKKENSVEND